ncbi:MAG TPA: DUF2785 domain-containing protein [Thermoanaerobaculia bacterium]
MFRAATALVLLGFSSPAFAATDPCPFEPWSRADLVALKESDSTLDAAKRDELARGLVACLGSPDPELRDDVAFTVISRWLRAKELEQETIIALAESMVSRLEDAGEDPSGFRKPFAALALSEVVRADRIDAVFPETLRRKLAPAAARYLTGVRDYRAFDPVEGWRHGVAHGADLVLQLGLNPHIPEEEVRLLLDSVASQTGPTTIAYDAGEPERLARAVFFVHGRNLLGEAYWSQWFEKVGDPAPLSSWRAAFTSREGLSRRHNTLAFLHAIAFAARANPGPASDRIGALAHRELLRVMGG